MLYIGLNVKGFSEKTPTFFAKRLKKRSLKLWFNLREANNLPEAGL